MLVSTVVVANEIGRRKDKFCRQAIRPAHDRCRGDDAVFAKKNGADIVRTVS